MSYYTEAQLSVANSTNLATFLSAHGEQIKKSGSEYLWEKNQVWVKDNLWYSHYDVEGGYPIAFVMKYFSMSFVDAVAELLGRNLTRCTTSLIKEEQNKQLIPPTANSTMNHVYAYLVQTRFIAREIVHYFSHNRTLYESKKHDCVFVGLDDEGNPKFIQSRSTKDNFRMTETGSKIEYSFHHDGISEWLYVFEAPIDMLSYITLNPTNWEQHSYVALCSVSERAILHRLEVNKKIRNIVLCLDNDNAGIMASIRIRKSLAQRGYNNVYILTPNNKDWNEDLKEKNGVTPLKADADEVNAVIRLCREYIQTAKEMKAPTQLYSKICEVFTSIKNRMPYTKREQIEKLIYLLLLLSKDECRKCLNEVSWEETEFMLFSAYAPYADNGDTPMRLRQLVADMDDVNKLYGRKTSVNNIELYTKLILKAAMDCIRLLHYLDRKEKQCKE